MVNSLLLWRRPVSVNREAGPGTEAVLNPHYLNRINDTVSLELTL
jgi:hypothetical protein